MHGDESLAEQVGHSFDGTGDERLRFLLRSLTDHLHAFVEEVGLTEREWEQAIEFLTATGQRCDDKRQEFVLLSDVLGVSMAVESSNHPTGGTATESTVLGPFHVVESPVRALGDDIAAVAQDGDPCLVTGVVRDSAGQPLAGASVDVWQADNEGYYDVQRPGAVPEGNLRGLFTTGVDGAFWFRTVVPRYYPIPTDGPVGALLRATGRHPYRPAHIHFIVTADGHPPVTTHLFVDDSPYLDSDAVFGVKPSLVREFPQVDDAGRAAAHGLPNPFRTVHFDVTLR